MTSGIGDAGSEAENALWHRADYVVYQHCRCLLILDG